MEIAVAKYASGWHQIEAQFGAMNAEITKFYADWTVIDPFYHAFFEYFGSFGVIKGEPDFNDVANLKIAFHIGFEPNTGQRKIFDIDIIKILRSMMKVSTM